MPFVPFEARAYRLVNGVAFSPDDRSMIFALLQREVLAHRGRPNLQAAETALYSAMREGDGWSEPVLLPLSGTFADYEPALATDGSFLIFNTKRPYADGRVPARNDLWLSIRRGDDWQAPQPLGNKIGAQRKGGNVVERHGLGFHYKVSAFYLSNRAAGLSSAAPA